MSSKITGRTSISFPAYLYKDLEKMLQAAVDNAPDPKTQLWWTQIMGCLLYGEELF